ncbi:MAG: FIG00635934: hypothetical protein, partial [uncultured Sphingomonas sp.]
WSGAGCTSRGLSCRGTRTSAAGRCASTIASSASCSTRPAVVAGTSGSSDGPPTAMRPTRCWRERWNSAGSCSRDGRTCPRLTASRWRGAAGCDPPT